MDRLFARLVGGVALGLLLSSGALLLSAGADAQDKIELKFAYFVGDQHAMSKWLIKWSQTLEQRSNGSIVVKRFPAAQLA